VSEIVGEQLSKKTAQGKGAPPFPPREKGAGAQVRPGDGDRKTQREIARSLGISRSYVSRIEKRAISKLAREFTLEAASINCSLPEFRIFPLVLMNNKEKA
jgi:RNA polymerase sporulation-specific sigma factor